MYSKSYMPSDKYDWLVIDILHDEYIEYILRKLLKHDAYTCWHCISVAKESVRIADCIGLSQEKMKEVGTAAILHDIGKIEIPAEIVRKPGNLTDAEFDCIKQHPKIGADMVCQTGSYSAEVIQGIRNHHVNMDGSGYGECKPCKPGLYERIIRIADSFDAMTDNRPYHKACKADKAVLQLRENRGTFYDPFLLDVFTCLCCGYKIDKSIELDFGALYERDLY
jgi:putative nucleotidyltransferase with HDIG domain